MPASNTEALLAAITTIITAGAGAAMGIGKLVQMQRRGRIETFQHSLQALQEENARCWADNQRKQQRIEELEMELGRHPRSPDEDGPPR